MENAEEVFHFLEEFSKRKPKTIPQELNDYLAYVARTGDPVYQWSLVKSLFKEKLLSVITDFYETTPGIDIPPYPNVDPFNYDIMKNSLLERIDSFTSAPFTVQRICELLTYPRKQYNRIDKFMRAIEKNILVVSTREPGTQRHQEPENGEPMEPIVNGSDNNSEYNVDVEMEDMSWKENADQQQNSEPQPGSSDAHISVNDIEARLQAKKDPPMDTQEKNTTQYESVTPPELNVTTDEQITEYKPSNESNAEATTSVIEENVTTDSLNISAPPDEQKFEVDMKTETPSSSTIVIPEIKVDDAEMTEQKLKQAEKSEETNEIVEEKESTNSELKDVETRQLSPEKSSTHTNIKEELESKPISEVSTSSEESSSSSDNTDGNSNSPKTDNESHIDVQEDSNHSDVIMEETNTKQAEESKATVTSDTVTENSPQIQSDNYSISDVNSELPQPLTEANKTEESTPPEVTEPVPEEKGESSEEKSESTTVTTEN